jgi:hypothetical protein
MVIYLELFKEMSPDDVTRLLHQQLLEIDKDYRDLAGFLKYVPLKVQLLPRGTFQRYLREKEGQSRVERIFMREDRFKRLISGKE